MQRHIMDKYREQYAETLIKLDPYLLRSINLVPNQTFLRLKGYNIAGVLAFISFKEIHLLAVLSEREILLLQSFVDNLGAFLCALERPGNKEPLRLHIPVSVLEVSEMPGRSSIGIVKLKLKNIPPDILELVCNLFDELEARKLKYERYAETLIRLDDAEARIPGMLDQAELSANGKAVKLRLIALSSTKAQVEVLSVAEAFPQEGLGLLRCKGPTGGLSFEVELDANIKLGESILKLQYSNELLSLLDAMNDRIMHTRRLKAAFEAKKAELAAKKPTKIATKDSPEAQS